MGIKRTAGDEQRHLAQVCLSNTVEDAGIQARVSAQGYTPEVMAEGRAMYAKAVSAKNEQVAAWGAKKMATAQVSISKKLAESAYGGPAKTTKGGSQL